MFIFWTLALLLHWIFADELTIKCIDQHHLRPWRECCNDSNRFTKCMNVPHESIQRVGMCWVFCNELAWLGIAQPFVDHGLNLN